MLTIAPETVFYILIKAREFDVKVAPEDSDSGSNPTDDKDVAILEDRADDATQQELMAALGSLNVDEMADLLALTWLGRGDFTTWEEAIVQARESRNERAAAYLAGTPLLSDYLENALNEIGYSIEDFEVDRL